MISMKYAHGYLGVIWNIQVGLYRLYAGSTKFFDEPNKLQILLSTSGPWNNSLPIWRVIVCFPGSCEPTIIWKYKVICNLYIKVYIPMSMILPERKEGGGKQWGRERIKEQESEEKIKSSQMYSAGHHKVSCDLSCKYRSCPETVMDESRVDELTCQK